LHDGTFRTVVLVQRQFFRPECDRKMDEPVMQIGPYPCEPRAYVHCWASISPKKCVIWPEEGVFRTSDDAVGKLRRFSTPRRFLGCRNSADLTC